MCIRDRIDGLGLRNIELKGFSDDIHKEYMESSLFFLSSRYEGFVLVLMEAMATGLPAVSFRCKEGPEETIDNGINGYLVEEGNVQQFADCAIKLMKNETLLKQFASKTKKDLDRFNTAAIINPVSYTHLNIRLHLRISCRSFVISRLFQKSICHF